MNAPLASPTLDLKPLHLPEPVGLWPLAPGWWVLLVMLGVLVILAVVGYRRYRARRAIQAPGRAALHQWQALLAQYGDESSTAEQQQLLVAANQLLKRVALAYHGPTVAHLSGVRWYAYLTQCAQGKFSTAALEVLVVGPYQYPPPVLDKHFTNAVTQWLQHAPYSEVPDV